MHDTLLLFGATGDLARRVLFRSLLHLLRDRLLPDTFRVVAVGRSEHDDAGFKQWLRGRLDDGDDRDAAVVDDLLARIRYLSLDLNDSEAMRTALSAYADRPCVSYLSTPPDLFEPACRGLKAAGLLEGQSRLVLEKPIGRDLSSARAINATLGAALDESRIFRIDHYLGKAPVQNLLALRFGNTLMEAVWQHRWIESVDILVAETAGVDGREGYYANYGALRDMVQNHMLQLLALIAMEPPSELCADSVRDEKTKVLRALRPMTAADVGTDSVRGRYTAGVVEGEAVNGFTHDSDVETFVALSAWIDNWRWAGVPFRLVTGGGGGTGSGRGLETAVVLGGEAVDGFTHDSDVVTLVGLGAWIDNLRWAGGPCRVVTGKRMPSRTTEVVVSFKPVSHWIYERPDRRRGRPNRLRMRLQPEETIELGLMGSLAAPDWGATERQPMSLDLSMSSTRSEERRVGKECIGTCRAWGSPA